MLPPPTICFTIPSIHDDLVLNCRIYHPICLAPTLVSHLVEWRRKAAIVAHPYAPLGGCYDDPVVEVVAAEILKQGFIVGTFNFRGASSGHTSWSSKAEQNDYVSFIGFMIYYMHHLCPPPLPFDIPDFTRSDPEVHDLTPIPSRAVLPSHLADPYEEVENASLNSEDDTRIPNNEPRLLLAGYSYGSLVTMLLPPIITSILPPFQNPKPESAYAEIRLRACNLATQQNQSIHEHMIAFHNSRVRRGRSLHSADMPHSPKHGKSHGAVRVGGDENLRRSSQESYRSTRSFTAETQEKVKKSLDRVRSVVKRGSPKKLRVPASAISSRKARTSDSISSIDSPVEGFSTPLELSPLKEVPGICHDLQIAYLLISPLQGIVGSLATMWKLPSWRAGTSISENEMKLVVDPSLAIFGDDDIFVSVSKLRHWVQKLSDAGPTGKRKGNQFRYREVEGAGHFWHDYEKVRVLRESVAGFVGGL